MNVTLFLIMWALHYRHLRKLR